MYLTKETERYKKEFVHECRYKVIEELLVNLPSLGGRATAAAVLARKGNGHYYF